MGSESTGPRALSPQQAREQIEAALDAIDAAHAVLRSTASDGVGTAFRVSMAERLETAERTNRAMMYRVFAEVDAIPEERASGAARCDLWRRSANSDEPDRPGCRIR